MIEVIVAGSLLVFGETLNVKNIHLKCKVLKTL